MVGSGGPTSHPSIQESPGRGQTPFRCRNVDIGQHPPAATEPNATTRATGFTGTCEEEKHVVTRLMIVLICAYRKLLSPVLPSSCRFIPSCSSFAIDAYRKYGFWHGSRLSTGRLLRCGPWCRGGYDPVPEEIRSTTEQHLHTCRELE